MKMYGNEWEYDDDPCMQDSWIGSAIVVALCCVVIAFAWVRDKAFELVGKINRRSR